MISKCGRKNADNCTVAQKRIERKQNSLKKAARHVNALCIKEKHTHTVDTLVIRSKLDAHNTAVKELLHMRSLRNSRLQPIWEPIKD